MSPILARLRRVRAILTIGVALRGLVCGLAAALSVFIGGALMDLVAPLSIGVRQTLFELSVAAGGVIAATMWWRDRGVRSTQRVALWIEERFPHLEYTLISAIETNNERLLNGDAAGWTSTASRRSARVLRWPLAAAVIAFIVIVLLPAGAVARMRAPHAGDSLDRAGLRRRADASRLSPLVADVVPPSYTGLASSTVDEPADVRALVGSTITLRGRGDGTGIRAVTSSDTAAASTRDDRWSIALTVRDKPVAIRVTDRRFVRIVAIEPIADAAPTVTLVSPARDSVLRSPRGTIALAADVSDDFGITASSFEYIISSGEGETFTFRSGTIGAIRPNAKRASLSARLSLESLGLKPGDIVHLRAVARDGNTISGPGLGASETRAIRIARADEYDSVAVDAAAPSEEEKGVISERMLIMLTEALEKKRPSMGKPAVVNESQSIAVDQKRLRRSVGDIVFTRLGGSPRGEEHKDEDSPARAKTMQEMLARADSATSRSIDPIDFEGGESPVVAVNTPLLEAYNAMWDASSELEIGEPGRALPHMRRALAAIQRARTAERLYLRGAPPRVVIDVNSARLKGKDKGSASQRRPIPSADSVSRARLDRFTRILTIVPRDASAAIDSLLLLRIDALTDEPAFAAALSDAVDAMRKSKSADAVFALSRARRSLAGTPVVSDSLGKWSVVP